MPKKKSPEASAYEADVSGLRIRIEWDGDQTTVELASGGPGQQQQQAVSVASGAWRAAPALYRTAHGLVLVIEGASATAGVTIGHDAIVAAASLVVRDVPANTLVAGVPARVVRRDVRHWMDGLEAADAIEQVYGS